MSTSQEILELTSRLEVALAVRHKLLERRQAMIKAWKATGIKADADEFRFVRDSIAINDETIRAFRAALAAVSGRTQ